MQFLCLILNQSLIFLRLPLDLYRLHKVFGNIPQPLSKDYVCNLPQGHVCENNYSAIWKPKCVYVFSHSYTMQMSLITGKCCVTVTYIQTPFLFTLLNVRMDPGTLDYETANLGICLSKSFPRSHFNTSAVNWKYQKCFYKKQVQDGIVKSHVDIC